jgi:hypothetical protein
MAIKRDAPVQTLDAAVGAAIGDEDDLRTRRAKSQGMTRGERKKAEADRKRNRAMFDLPEALERVLDEVAKEVGCPRSQVAAYLMVRGLEQVTLRELKTARGITRSMRYEWVLQLPDIPRGLKGM